MNSRHLHSAYLSPDKKCLFASDLGTDSIYTFEVVREQNRIVGLKANLPTYIQTLHKDAARHSELHLNGAHIFMSWVNTLGEFHGIITMRSVWHL